MAHTHPVVDSDSRFVINSTTRVISTTSDKLELIQGDHQSERITFEIPKIVEGHDMSLCDRIEIHYINIDRRTSATSRDVYIADDAAVDGDKLIFSWLISGNATKYYGRLNFIILFECLDPDGNYTYKWNTEICKLLTIGEGISNTSAVIEDHSDILEKFSKEILEEACEKSVQPDWNQNDETSPDYVKNRPFYTSTEETVLLEESTVSFTNPSAGFYYAVIPTTIELTSGETYKVYWDGTTYECVCESIMGYAVIGNPSIIGVGADTGVPFVITPLADDNGTEIYTKDASASHTISISVFAGELVKIDTKYLPISTDDSYGVIKRSDIVSAYNLPANAPHDQMVDAVTAFETGNASIVWDGVKVISADYNSSTDKIFVQFAGEPLSFKIFENLDGFYIRTIASSIAYAELQGEQARIFNSEGTYTVLSTEGVQSNSTLRTSANNFSIKGEIRGYSLVLRSSTKNSTKRFRITVDDSGTISATEVT
jgi:hypothetical protein